MYIIYNILYDGDISCIQYIGLTTSMNYMIGTVSLHDDLSQTIIIFITYSQ